MGKLDNIKAQDRVRITGPRFARGEVVGSVIDVRSEIARVQLDGEDGEALVYESLGGMRAVVRYAVHCVDVEITPASANDATAKAVI